MNVTDLRDGQWHHIGFTIDGKGDRKVYVDGQYSDTHDLDILDHLLGG